MLPIVILSSFILSVNAIIPVLVNRFVDDIDCYKVPNADIDFTSLNLDSVTKKDAVSYTNASETILNIIPGISLLQTDSNNECYFVETIIGENEYPLIIDTGSAYLWVYGEDCSDSACNGHSLYTSTSSSDQETSTFALAYVTGSAVGDVVEDNIIVNQLATTDSFKFGMANEVPDFFSNYPVSGVFGLPSNDSSSIESIISALYQSHAISVQRFTILIGEINPNSNDTDFENAGIFSIGDPVEELYLGSLNNVSLIENSANYWMILIDQVLMNYNAQVAFTNYTSYEADGVENWSNIIRTAIVDSGTTVLALPKQDAIDLHAYFQDSITDGTNFAILCNSSLIISLNLNGILYSIPPESYLGAAYSEDSGYDGYCVSNIQGITSEYWILGAVFLKNVYADFNVEDQMIGFAERNTDVILTSTATDNSSSSTISIASTSTTASTSSTTSTSSYSTNIGNTLPISILSLFSSLITIVLL